MCCIVIDSEATRILKLHRFTNFIINLIKFHIPAQRTGISIIGYEHRLIQIKVFRPHACKNLLYEHSPP